MSQNAPASLKHLQETVLTLLVLRQPNLVATAVLPVLEDYERHRPHTTAAAVVAAQALAHGPPSVRRALLGRTVRALLPWAAIQNNSLRSFALLTLAMIFDALEAPWLSQRREGGGEGGGSNDDGSGSGDSDMWLDAFDAGGLALLRSLSSFLDGNADVARLRSTLGNVLLGWSPAGAAAPQRVYCCAPDGGANGVGGAAVAAGSAVEGAPAGLVDAIHAFVLGERQALREDMARRVGAAEAGAGGGASSSAEGAANTAADGGGASTAAAAEAAALAAERSLAAAFQRKITPMEAVALLSDLFGERDGERTAVPAAAAAAATAPPLQRAPPGGAPLAAERAAVLAATGVQAAALDAAAAAARALPAAPPLPGGAGAARRPLLVVASLVDKPPNLGGLARTAEILGASGLVVGDARVLKDPAFVGTAVTADRWLPIVEVPEAALVAWLLNRRAAGYALVGLEQTADSAPLPDFSFPRRCCLVLGREKEGLPPELLALMDATVEIPQAGVVRSLNVHVSAALAMYEYARQQPVGAGAAAGGGGGGGGAGSGR